MENITEAKKMPATAEKFGGETFTVTRKTYYTAPSGKRMLATVDVQERQPFLPVAP